jgi:TIR domain-containing protein
MEYGDREMSTNESAIGFWSYVRLDDHAEGGRITRLAARIQAEYAVLTGTEIQIFIDREDIAWGHEWRRRIEDALVETTFFIPVVTPRYFQSSECRRELLTFAMHAESLGVADLLLPLVYVDVPALHDEQPEDDAIALVARTHYETWTELRLHDEASPEYRRGINKLAKRLVEIASQLDAPPQAFVSTLHAAEQVDEDDEPGDLDVLAASEDALPELGEIIERFGEVMTSISEATLDATQKIELSDAAGKGFAGRVVASQALALELAEPVAELRELGLRYASRLATVDAGILTLIRKVGEEELSPEEEQEAHHLFDSIRNLCAVSRESVDVLEELSESTAKVARMARALRKPSRDLQDGLRAIMDGQVVMDEWARQIELTEAARQALPAMTGGKSR